MSFVEKYNSKSPAVKRIMREAKELYNASDEFCAYPLDDNLFEWHFTIHGPPSTDFEGGIYHGRILLPPEYPMQPPSIILLTPNGRFEINKKICLSISGHHPETWQPSWSIRTALLALIAFMPTAANGTIGSIDYTSEERRKLAWKSLIWKCSNCGEIAKLFTTRKMRNSISFNNLATPEIFVQKKLTEHHISSSGTSLKIQKVNFLSVDNISNENQDFREETSEQLTRNIQSKDFFWNLIIALLLTTIIYLIFRRILLL